MIEFTTTVRRGKSRADRGVPSSTSRYVTPAGPVREAAAQASARRNVTWRTVWWGGTCSAIARRIALDFPEPLGAWTTQVPGRDRSRWEGATSAAPTSAYAASGKCARTQLSIVR